MTITTTSPTIPFSPIATIELSRRRDEPEWLAQQRLAAWTVFDAAALPTLERTDLSKFNIDAFGLSMEPAASLPTHIYEAIATPNSAERAGLLVQSNGEALHVSLEPSLVRRGVIMTTLSDAVKTHGELVQKYLGQLVPGTEGKFPALNTAFWSGGLFVYVPRNVAIEAPIQVVFHADAAGGSVFPRVLVVAEENAEVTILEEYLSPATDQPMLAVPVVEVVAAENAHAKYVHIQDWAENVVTFVTQRGEAANFGSVSWTLGHLGARLMRSYTETRMAGEGSSTRMLGVQFGTGKQHHDIYTLMNHVAPLTDGDLLFRGVLRDTSRSVFEGLIKIHPGAQDSNSYLHDNTLLLSDNARADSIPSLEIEANQVRASHGATVSQVDEDWIFYLQTRGLTRGEAIRTIVDGFFEPIMQRITLPSVRGRLRAEFDRKMGVEAHDPAGLWDTADEEVD